MVLLPLDLLPLDLLRARYAFAAMVRIVAEDFDSTDRLGYCLRCSGETFLNQSNADSWNRYKDRHQSRQKECSAIKGEMRKT